MKYKFVFWDWNGTIFNDTLICFEITNELLSEIGVPNLSYDEYRKKLRHPIKEFYDEVTKSDSTFSYAEFSEKFHAHYENRRYSCGIHEDVLETIAFFKSYNIKQSILSAHPQFLLDSIVSHLNINHHFDHVIGASDKLAADKFKEGEKLMKLYGADPCSTLIIGDTQHDAEVAERLGIDCILVSQGMQCKTRLTHLTVPVVDTVNEIKLLVLSAN
jgi:phosphoglycolate phosphatase